MQQEDMVNSRSRIPPCEVVRDNSLNTRVSKARANEDRYKCCRTIIYFEIVLISLQMKHPVWFACNICTDVDTTRQGMTNELYRPDLLLRTAYKNKMTKKERMNYGRAKCNHAMKIVDRTTFPST